MYLSHISICKVNSEIPECFTNWRVFPTFEQAKQHVLTIFHSEYHHMFEKGPWVSELEWQESVFSQLEIDAQAFSGTVSKLLVGSSSEGPSLIKITFQELQSYALVQHQKFKSHQTVRNDLIELGKSRECSDVTIMNIPVNKTLTELRTGLKFHQVRKRLSSFSKDEIKIFVEWVFGCLYFTCSIKSTLTKIFKKLGLDGTILIKRGITDDLKLLLKDEKSKDFGIIIKTKSKKKKIEKEKEKEKNKDLNNQKEKNKDLNNLQSPKFNPPKNKSNSNNFKIVDENNLRNSQNYSQTNVRNNFGNINNDNNTNNLKTENCVIKKVHKFVLHARSGLFKSMFQSIKNIEKQITDYSYRSLKFWDIFLEYLYTGEIQRKHINEKVLEELMDAENFFQLNSNESLSEYIKWGLYQSQIQNKHQL
ncbi:ankyrin repeat and btb/poz domain-containing protein 2-like protein [Anaeramoeba flamelloides]|uniref:Ankyrin repeat and btb/poz domain-containing protein 2-like protein n=1 Tax=Anaeramoeba flamelloides TaxID=1746091 RepID=A0AAV8A0L0_9EUKA|nr:ankyrin repeat and btb/poz domain-containing protein 2-like protein [Anaeramoeba flamelloides]